MPGKPGKRKGSYSKTWRDLTERESRDRSLYSFLDYYCANRSLEEIGEAYGVSRERIRQIVSKESEEWEPSAEFLEKTVREYYELRESLVSSVKYNRRPEMLRMKKAIDAAEEEVRLFTESIKRHGFTKEEDDAQP